MHHFNCQSNQDSWSYILQIILAFLGAFFGFGFSLWLYYKQLKKERKNVSNQEKKKFENLLYFYKELLISISDLFEKQLSLIDDFIKEQKKNLTVLIPLQQYATSDFKRIKNIGNKGIFEAWNFFFNSNNSIKEYKKANSALDFLDGTRKEMNRIYKTNTKQCYEKLSDAKTIIDHIPDRLAIIAHEMANSLGDKRWEDKLYTTIDSYFPIYTDLTTDIADFEEINKKYLEPILILFNATYKDFAYSDEITLLCKKARVKLQDVRFEMQNIIDQFERTRERTAKSLEIVKDTIQRINELTISK